MTRTKHIILCALAALLATPGWSQELQLASKTIEQTFPYQHSTEVNIEGQKAEVYIETWEREQVAVRLVLESLHPDRQQAAAGLERMAYQLEQIQGKVYVRNYAKGGGSSPDGPSLSAKYFIRVPADCPVYLKNHFGSASISNLNSRLQVNSRYTQIGLENVQGVIDVSTRFGDLVGRQLDGTMTVNARRSNIDLHEIRGTYDITSQYGSIRVFTDPNLIRLNIDATRSDVFLYSAQPEIFSYDIEANHAKVRTPEWMRFKSLPSTEEASKSSYVPNREYYARISVKINFGELFVEKLK